YVSFQLSESDIRIMSVATRKLSWLVVKCPNWDSTLSRNSLNQRRLWRIVHEQKWRVIQIKNGRSGAHADRLKHGWVTGQI
ncbi:hypothetical protein, partial [Nitrosomonas sp.]|uniref:hypothetical protein n=1 Tax=Nitrosomonas sp. TaxID=42353 RepID=UPI001D290247